MEIKFYIRIVEYKAQEITYLIDIYVLNLFNTDNVIVSYSFHLDKLYNQRKVDHITHIRFTVDNLKIFVL